MGGLFGDGGASIGWQTQRDNIEYNKEKKRKEQEHKDRITRSKNYAKSDLNAITDNLLSVASYLSANSQGDTTLSQESLLNLGGKLG